MTNNVLYIGADAAYSPRMQETKTAEQTDDGVHMQYDPATGDCVPADHGTDERASANQQQARQRIGCATFAIKYQALVRIHSPGFLLGGVRQARSIMFDNEADARAWAAQCVETNQGCYYNQADITGEIVRFPRA